MDASDLPEDLTPDELVDAVLKGAPEPPRLSVLKGFLGTSDARGYHRLFTDETFRRWLDIRDDAIVHRRRIAVEPDGLDGTMLWVEDGALLVRGEVTSTADAEADFLKGALSAKARLPLIDEGAASPAPPGADEAQVGSPAASPKGEGCCPFKTS